MLVTDAGPEATSASRSLHWRRTRRAGRDQLIPAATLRQRKPGALPDPAGRLYSKSSKTASLKVISESIRPCRDTFIAWSRFASSRHGSLDRSAPRAIDGTSSASGLRNEQRPRVGINTDQQALLFCDAASTRSSPAAGM